MLNAFDVYHNFQPVYEMYTTMSREMLSTAKIGRK